MTDPRRANSYACRCFSFSQSTFPAAAPNWIILKNAFRRFQAALTLRCKVCAQLHAPLAHHTSCLIRCCLTQVEPYEDAADIHGAVNMVLRLRWVWRFFFRSLSHSSFDATMPESLKKNVKKAFEIKNKKPHGISVEQKAEIHSRFANYKRETQAVHPANSLPVLESWILAVTSLCLTGRVVGRRALHSIGSLAAIHGLLSSFS